MTIGTYCSLAKRKRICMGHPLVNKTIGMQELAQSRSSFGSSCRQTSCHSVVPEKGNIEHLLTSERGFISLTFLVIGLGFCYGLVVCFTPQCIS